MGGVLFEKKPLIKHELALDKAAEKTRSEEYLMKCVKRKCMGVAYLKRPKEAHQKLITTIQDHHAFGVDVYPKTLGEKLVSLLSTNSRRCKTCITHIWTRCKKLKRENGKRNTQQKLDVTMIDIPDTIKELHSKINLSVAFLHSTSRGYKYRTVKHYKDYKRKYKKIRYAEWHQKVCE